MTSQELIDAIREAGYAPRPYIWRGLRKECVAVNISGKSSYPQARPDLKPNRRHVFDSALSIPERFSGVLRPDMLWCDCGAALYDAGERWEIL